MRKYTRRTAKQIPSPGWKNAWFMLWTCPRTTMELAFPIRPWYFATILFTWLETEPRSVPWTLAYTSNTGCTL